MRTLGVGVIGLGWMGRVHAQAYLRVGHHHPDLAVTPRLVAAADPVAGLREDAARRYGFARTTATWQDLLDDPDIHAVSVTVPNFLHREVGVAVARAGKHLWIEKPVGRGSAEARDVAAAVAGAGVQSTVGFNYRNAPAVAYARELVAAGRVGAVTHVRFQLFSDYAADPSNALTWRFTREESGSGVLGDLMSHAVDLARYVVGEIDAVVADEATFIPERPVAGGGVAVVENDDYVGCLVRFAGGARGSVEACRVSVGEQNTYGFDVHGTEGAVSWDFRRMGELRVSTGDGYGDVGATTVFVGPQHGDFAAFQPGAGIAMGYDDLKVIEAANFLRSVAEGKPYGPTVDDGVRAALVLDAMTESVRTGAWCRVESNLAHRDRVP